MKMYIDEPRHHIGTLGIEHPVVLAGLGRLRDFRNLSVHNLDRSAGHVHSGADDMGVNYDCFHSYLSLNMQCECKIFGNYIIIASVAVSLSQYATCCGLRSNGYQRCLS